MFFKNSTHRSYINALFSFYSRCFPYALMILNKAILFCTIDGKTNYGLQIINFIQIYCYIVIAQVFEILGNRTAYGSLNAHFLFLTFFFIEWAGFHQVVVFGVAQEDKAVVAIAKEDKVGIALMGYQIFVIDQMDKVVEVRMGNWVAAVHRNHMGEFALDGVGNADRGKMVGFLGNGYRAAVLAVLVDRVVEPVDRVVVPVDRAAVPVDHVADTVEVDGVAAGDLEADDVEVVDAATESSRIAFDDWEHSAHLESSYRSFRHN